MSTKTRVPIAHKIIHLIITAVTLALMFVIPSLGYTQDGTYEGLTMFNVFTRADQVSFIIFMITVAVFVISVVMALINKPGLALAFHISAFALLAGSTVVAFLYLSNNSFKYYVLYPYIAIAALPFIQIFLYILTMVSSSSEAVVSAPAVAPTAAPVQPFVPQDAPAPAPSFVPITPNEPVVDTKADEVEIEVSEIAPAPVQDNAVFTNPAQPEYVSPFIPEEQTEAPAEEAAPVAEADDNTMSSVYDSDLNADAPVDEAVAPAYGESAFDQADEMTSEYDTTAEATPAAEAPVYAETPAFAENSPVFPEYGTPAPVDTTADSQTDNSDIAAMYEQAMTGGYTAPVAAESVPVVAPIASAVEEAVENQNDRVLPHVSELDPMAISMSRPVKHVLTEDEEILIHEKIGQVTKQFKAEEITEEEYNRKVEELRNLL